MNAERLVTIIDFLLASEKANQIQNGISGLNDALNQMVSQPNSPDFQKNVAAAVDKLENSFASFFSKITPSQKKDILEIKGTQFFSPVVTDDIRALIQKNAMTPAVIQQRAGTLLSQRNEYIESLRATSANLKKLGITPEKLQPGQTEIGILIPRDLFNNDFEGLNKELRNIIFILRSFYEASNVTPGPMEVRDISTSDPTFFLGIDITVLVHLGHAVRWCIDVIGTTLKLREVVEMARKVEVNPKAIEIMNEGIKTDIDKRIEEKVLELMGKYAGPADRKSHVEDSLSRAMNMLLERVERGVTIDIRLIPPPKPAEGDQDAQATQNIFDELQKISQRLEYPQIQGQPTLRLTSVESENPPAKISPAKSHPAKTPPPDKPKN